MYSYQKTGDKLMTFSNRDVAVIVMVFYRSVLGMVNLCINI